MAASLLKYVSFRRYYNYNVWDTIQPPHSAVHTIYSAYNYKCADTNHTYSVTLLLCLHNPMLSKSMEFTFVLTFLSVSGVVQEVWAGNGGDHAAVLLPASRRQRIKRSQPFTEESILRPP